jgi:Mg2+ and Co2+ transporter CorA
MLKLTCALRTFKQKKNVTEDKVCLERNEAVKQQFLSEIEELERHIKKVKKKIEEASYSD